VTALFAQVTAAALLGLRAVQVTVEVDVGGGLPQITLVGLPDTAVQEAKERVRAAIKNSGFALPQRRIIVNLAPADLRKEGPSFDLPIAIGILAASGVIEGEALANTLMVGELALDGTLRPVAGVLPIAASAAEMGIRRLVVPQENGPEGAVVQGIQVYGLPSLAAVVGWLQNPEGVEPVRIQPEQMLPTETEPLLDLADVKGQEHARRALEIAAAGGHNLLLVGSPGAGKTMLARRLPGILPQLQWEEMLEITRIYSAAG
jgi:magnesium chelatase family protein